MSRLVPALLTCALLSGCIDLLDSSWFNPRDLSTGEYLTELDLYDWREVPDEYVELVELTGTALDGEDEAPTLYGMWAHQCVDGACVNLGRSEFDPDNQDKTILYLHGNASHVPAYWDRVEMLWFMGYRVFAVDYRDYGNSSGDASEEGVFADASTALDHVLARIAEETGVEDPNPLFIDLAYYGWSLGSTAAIDLAVERPAKALITEAALASAQAFLDDASGLGISSTVLMDAEFDNLGKIPFVISPKLITHGLDDDFVRWEFSQALYDAAEEPKQLYTVAGGVPGSVPCPSRDPAPDIRFRNGEDNHAEWPDGEVGEPVPPPDEYADPCRADEAWLETVSAFLDEHMP